MTSTTAIALEERLRKMEPVAAPPEQHADVVELFRLLSGVRATALPLAGAHGHPACVLQGPGGERLLIPESAYYVFRRVAEVLARGDAVTVVPVGKQLTTQQAADLLNISRQYLIRLLDEGKIPQQPKIGKHRRVAIEDVLAYKQKRDRESAAALRELTKLSQEFGGYDELK